MKSKFKVGDTVRLKKNLKVGQHYDGYELYEGMIDLFKEPSMITKVSTNQGIAYSVMFEGNPFYYPVDMLIKVKPED